MTKHLLTARHVFSARNEEQLRLRLRASLDRRRRSSRVHIEPHDVSDRLYAYVNHGRWLADCVCGSGVMVDPSFQIACCFECAAIYSRIIFPTLYREIERRLVQRVRDAHRNWIPGETLAMLDAENEANNGLAAGG